MQEAFFLLVGLVGFLAFVGRMDDNGFEQKIFLVLSPQMFFKLKSIAYPEIPRLTHTYLKVTYGKKCIVTMRSYVARTYQSTESN